MVLVEEMPKQSHTMEFIIRIGIIQLLQYLELLQTSLVHHFIVPNDLNRHLQVGLQGVPRPHHITEHPLSSVAVHGVPSVQLLSDTNTYK